MPLSLRVRLDARLIGGLLCLSGLGLVWWREPVGAALGVECIATAFWCWARASSDRADQLARWAWLRRPAAALWLAAAIHAVLPVIAHGGVNFLATRGLGAPEQPLAPLIMLQELAVLWAGLELLAALPLSRPFPDLPGPLLAVGPWLPVALPAAGFVVLWRQSSNGLGVPELRDVARVLLLLAATLASLRAFSRRPWTASLRWLAVCDAALAAVLVSLRVVRPEVSLVLWIGAFGGHAALLAGELRGAAPRRGPVLSLLWRMAAWTALAALAWPVVASVAFGPRGFSLFYLIAASLPVLLSASVTVHRMVEAPERRAVPRYVPSISVSLLSALIVLASGPLALLMAWWTGFEASWPGSVVALLPAVIGGWSGMAALRARPTVLDAPSRLVGAGARNLANTAFKLVTELERGLVHLLDGVLRGLTAPVRDLHTGDAQEYLLFLIGASVLALLLPLLR